MVVLLCRNYKSTRYAAFFQSLKHQIQLYLYRLAGLSLLALAVWIVFSSIHGFFSIVAGVAGFWLLAKSIAPTEPQNLFNWVSRFEQANPTQSGVPGENELMAKLKEGVGPNTTPPGNQVLVCEDKRFVDFFLANEFHLRHACPVIGIGGYPLDVFPGLMERLKQSEKADVFVIHSLTPSGLEFARSVRWDESWFGGFENVNVVDLGLRPSQKPLVDTLMRPINEIPGRHTSDQVPGFTPGMGVELSTFRPERLIAMVALGIEERAPMRPIEEHLNKHYADEGATE